MRTLLLHTLILCLSGLLHGQTGDYVVPDYKGAAESFFSLSDSTLRAEVGSFTFTGSIIGLSGKVPLRQFELQSITHHTITLGLDELRVHVSRAPFFAEAHRIDYFGPQNYVYRIDGRFFWGFDGSLPRHRLVNVHLFKGDQRLSLPNRAFRDIFEPNFCSRRGLFSRHECYTKAFLSEDGRRIYIHMQNSRVPSLYEVTWIIVDGQYVGRVVDYAY